MNGWFPKLNAKGDVASGSGEIWVNNIRVEKGWHPGWLSEQEIIFLTETDIVMRNMTTGLRRSMTGAYSQVHSAWQGTWWGFVAQAQTLNRAFNYTHHLGDRIDADVAKISPDGTRTVMATPYHQTSRSLLLNDVAIYAGNVMNYSVCNTCVVIQVHPGTSDPHERQVIGIKWGGGNENLTLFKWEDPVVCDSPSGPWVLSVTQTGLVLRPWGQTVGYRWEGEHLNPDVKWIGNGVNRFKIVASDARGNLLVHDVDPNSPRQELQGTEPEEPVPPDPPDPEPPMPTPNWSNFYAYMEQRWAVLPKNAASVDQIVREYHHGTSPATSPHTGFGFLKKDSGTNYNGHSEDWILERLSDGSVWGTDTVVSLGSPSATISHNTPTPEPNPQNWMQPPPLNGGGTQPPSDLEARVAALEAQVAALTANQVKLPKHIALRSSNDPNLGDSANKVVCVDANLSSEGILYANRDNPGPWETFEFIVID